MIAEIQAKGRTSAEQIAGALNDRGITAPRGGNWSPQQVCRVIERIMNCAGIQVGELQAGSRIEDETAGRSGNSTLMPEAGKR